MVAVMRKKKIFQVVESIRRITVVKPTGRRQLLPLEKCGLVVTAEGEEQVSGRHLPLLFTKIGFRVRVAGSVTREPQQSR